MNRKPTKQLWGRKRVYLLAGLALLAPITGSSCEAPDADQPSSPTGDLGPGATGAAVRAVQDLLGRLGYLPDGRLAEQDPSWRPIVAEAPSPGIYDAPTEAAVRAYQRMGHLLETGVVDAATRALMRQPRCGVPDGHRARDERDKYDLQGSFWPASKTTLTWRMISLPPGLTEIQTITAIQAAFDAWSGLNAPSGATNLTFNYQRNFTFPCDSCADIDISFGEFHDTNPPSLALAGSPNNPRNVGISVNTFYSWTDGTPTTGSGQFHLTSIMFHEIGHTLGLWHSQSPTAVMRSGLSPEQVFPGPDLDDKLAIGILYDVWQNAPGTLCAGDISVGPGDFGNFAVWAVGCGSAGGRPHRWMSNQWVVDHTGEVGLNIAVDAFGTPWMVQQGGAILVRSNNDPGSGHWDTIDGCGVDIGIGRGGDVWVTACGDGRLHKRVGNTWVADLNGFARRVAVDGFGRPWVTDFSNKIHRKTTNDPMSGTWEKMPGNAVDIAVSNPLGSPLPWVWMIGVNGGVFAFNEQSGLGGACDGGLGTCQRLEWRGKLGDVTAARIGMGGFGPWVSRSGGQVMRELNW
jgi:hypothetical protein